MRLLWIDGDGSPWSQGDGFSLLQQRGCEVVRALSAAEAKRHFDAGKFDVVVASLDLEGVEELLAAARLVRKKSGPRLVAISATRGKKEFQEHSKTSGAAHRYAKSPMPPQGFLKLLDELGVAPGAIPGSAQGAPPEVPSSRRERTAASADAEVLRKYLALKEDEAEELRAERDELRRDYDRMLAETKQAQQHARGFEHETREACQRAEQAESARRDLEQTLEEERRRARADVEGRDQRIQQLEKETRHASEKYDELRERVRKDIRRIRANERDLEAKLELTRKDSVTLIEARDRHVLELQRKIDALEFDLDQVQDRRVQAEMESERYLAKLSKVARTLHLAIGMIESEIDQERLLDELEGEVVEEMEAKEAERDAQAPAGAVTAPILSSSAGPTEGTVTIGVDDSASGTELGGNPAMGTRGFVPMPGMEPSSAEAPDLEALASDGEPTRVVSAEELAAAQEDDSGKASGT